MESWEETAYEDIELRRAKLFKKVVEEVPIAIYPFDVIVGRETEHLVAAPVFPDEHGDAIPGLWAEDGEIGGLLFKGALSTEDKEILRKSASASLQARPHLTTSKRLGAHSWAPGPKISLTPAAPIPLLTQAITRALPAGACGSRSSLRVYAPP